MGKFANWLDSAFGFQGASPGSRDVQRGGGNDPPSSVNPAVAQPYALGGPNAKNPRTKTPVPVQKIALTVAARDTDLLRAAGKRAAMVLSLSSGYERQGDMTAVLEGTQTPSVFDSFESALIKNVRLIPSAGKPDVLHSRDATLSGDNRRRVGGMHPVAGANWQELLQQASYSGNIPVVQPVQGGRPIGETNGAYTMALLRGDSEPRTFNPPDVSGLQDKGRGLTPSEQSKIPLADLFRPDETEAQ